MSDDYETIVHVNTPSTFHRYWLEWPEGQAGPFVTIEDALTFMQSRDFSPYEVERVKLVISGFVNA
jgi:hypothetical protein